MSLYASVFDEAKGVGWKLWLIGILPSVSEEQDCYLSMILSPRKIISFSIISPTPILYAEDIAGKCCFQSLLSYIEFDCSKI